MLRFYDQLRRQSQQVKRFEELIVEALGGGAIGDRGADRLLHQTRFLADRSASTSSARARVGALRRAHAARAADRRAAPPTRSATSSSRSPTGLPTPTACTSADFDLLARIPGLEALDIVVHRGACSRRVSTSGCTTGGRDRRDRTPRISPACAGRAPGARHASRAAPPTSRGGHSAIARRSSSAVARRSRRSPARRAGGARPRAVVFKRPLPYLYLAPRRFGAAGIPYQTVDALPLAAEPTSRPLDLVLDAVATRASRATRSSRCCDRRISPSRTTARSDARVDQRARSRAERGALPRRHRAARANWRRLAGTDGRASRRSCRRGAASLRAVASRASWRRCVEPRRRPSMLDDAARRFWSAHFEPLDDDDPFATRERRARAAIAADLCRRSPPRTRRTTIRRGPSTTWPPPCGAGSRTRRSPSPTGRTGVHLLDDQAARYGDFDDVTIVGLIENDWPERPRRNIFYPPALLKALGWPSEKDRRAAADARFLDLLASRVAHASSCRPSRWTTKRW